MTIRYKYKNPQAWRTNNWESYLIIHFGSPQGGCLPLVPWASFLSFASKPPVALKSGNHPVNYAVKTFDPMCCFIKMFSNPGDTVIDAFAGTHTTSISALVENRNAIAIEADQSQWLSAQNHVKEVVNSILDHMPISSSPSSLCSRRKSSDEKKATSALQPSPVAPVQSPQLISTPSPASLDTSMDEFFQQLPQPPSTSTVPSSNQLVCIICKQPAEQEENMEICSDISCLAHALTHVHSLIMEDLFVVLSTSPLIYPSNLVFQTINTHFLHLFQCFLYLQILQFHQCLTTFSCIQKWFFFHSLFYHPWHFLFSSLSVLDSFFDCTKILSQSNISSQPHCPTMLGRCLA